MKTIHYGKHCSALTPTTKQSNSATIWYWLFKWMTTDEMPNDEASGNNWSERENIMRKIIFLRIVSVKLTEIVMWNNNRVLKWSLQ